MLASHSHKFELSPNSTLERRVITRIYIVRLHRDAFEEDRVFLKHCHREQVYILYIGVFLFQQ